MYLFSKKSILCSSAKMEHWLVLSLLLTIVGFNLLLVQYAGFPQPVWDQWDAQALNLYAPYLQGNLSIYSLFEPHNEHRIFNTRLLSLLLLEVNGQWDPLLEMFVNVILHVVLLFILVRTLSGVSRDKVFIGSMVLGAVIWTLPFGWDNLLSGFQSQFYFLAIFSVLSIYFFVSAEVYKKAWWVSLIMAILAVLSMASGLLVFPILIALSLLQILRSKKYSVKTLSALFFIVVVFIICLSLMHEVPGHEELKAKSIVSFVISLMRSLAWPFINEPWLVILLYSPLLIMLATLLKTKRLQGSDIYMLAIACWVVLQAAAIAYSRGGVGNAPLSKYMDLLKIGLLLNGVALFRLVEFLKPMSEKAKSIGKIYYLTWFALAILGMFSLFSGGVHQEIKLQKFYGDIQLQALQKFIFDNDDSLIVNQPFRHIPYPNDKHLMMVLSDETIRSIMPPELSHIDMIVDSKLTVGFVTNGYYPAIPAIEQAQPFGSYGAEGDATEGILYTEYFSADTKKIKISIAGYAGLPGITLRLETEDGKIFPIDVKSPPKERWKDIYLSNPGGNIRLVIEDASKTYWVSVSGISEVGVFSYIVRYLLDRAGRLVLLGLFVFFLMLGNRSFNVMLQSES